MLPFRALAKLPEAGKAVNGDDETEARQKMAKLLNEPLCGGFGLICLKISQEPV